MIEASKTLTIRRWNGIHFELKLEPKGSNNKTRVVYSVINPETGKKQPKKYLKGLRANMTEKELMDEAGVIVDSLIHLMETGYNPLSGKIETPALTPNSRIDKAIEMYLEQRKKEFDNGTITKSRFSTSEVTLRVHFLNWLNKENFLHRKPASFTHSDFVNFFGAKTKERKWGKETRNTYREIIKQFWIYLKEHKVVEDYTGISKIKHLNTSRDSTYFKIYNEEELKIVNSLLRADPAYRNLYISAKLLYQNNIRLEEQLKLQLEDYNPNNQVLTIPPHKTKNGDESSFQISNEVATFLNERWEKYPKEYYILGLNNKPRPERLAYGAIGQRWRKFRTKYSKMVDEDGKPLLDENGKPLPPLIPHHLKFYALKHSSSFYAIEDGESLEALQKRLRHADLKTTRRYAEDRLNKPILKGSTDGRF